jgi:hypothetical protein
MISVLVQRVGGTKLKRNKIRKSNVKINLHENRLSIFSRIVTVSFILTTGLNPRTQMELDREYYCTLSYTL